MGFRAEKREQTDADRTSHANGWKQAVGDSRGLPTPTNTGLQTPTSAKYAADGDCRLVEGDLDIGGRYTNFSLKSFKYPVCIKPWYCTQKSTEPCTRTVV